MLVLSRKFGESIQIGDDVHLQIVRLTRGQVGIAIAAPKHINIRRCELPPREQSTGEEDQPQRDAA